MYFLNKFANTEAENKNIFEYLWRMRTWHIENNHEINDLVRSSLWNKIIQNWSYISLYWIPRLQRLMFFNFLSFLDFFIPSLQNIFVKLSHLQCCLSKLLALCSVLYVDRWIVVCKKNCVLFLVASFVRQYLCDNYSLSS